MATRRQAFQLAISAFTTGLAGCASERSHGSSPTMTPAPVPSETRSPTATRNLSPPLREFSIRDFTFDASVVTQFTAEHPARIETTFTNRSESPLTISSGTSPPFSSFWNEEREDDESLLIVPDMSYSIYDSPPLSGLETLPRTPTDPNCWRMTDQVVDLLRARETEVESGTSLVQPFDVYDFNVESRSDVCLAIGDYQFVNSIDLIRGNPADAHSSREVDLGFTLHIDGNELISVTERFVNS